MNFEPRAPIDFSSIKEFLERNSFKYPDKNAVITVDPHTLESFSITYKELQELVFRTAAWLEQLGIERNDNFAILMHNTTEVLIFELAGALIGATTVPLDSRRDTLERKVFKLEQTSSKALFEAVGDESAQDLEYIRKQKPEIKILSWTNFNELKEILPKSSPKNIYQGIETHYIILYTSGTTNMPKGVPLKISSCLLNAAGIARWQKFTEKDVFNLVLPLHHINSTIFSLSIILSGGTIVMNTIYSASGFWKVVEKFKCTNSSIVPTILHDLLIRADEYFEEKPDITSLVRVCIGSAPVLPEQTLKFVETFNVRVIQGYGQTETALRVTGVPVEISEESYKEIVKQNSIGQELANCEVAILDLNNNPMEEGEEGEICIRGPVLGDGYLNDPEATEFSFKDGWFHSGDMGFYKEMEVSFKSGEIVKDRFFFIVGRIKEIIIKGGVNISPSAIEDALHKNFPDIREVSVVGIPDKRMGEEIAAVIVPKEGVSTEEIDNEIKLKGGEINGLSPYEVPKRIFFTDSLPKTSTGKIQRVEVKKQIIDKIKNEQHHLHIKVIKPSETEVLKQALKINNSRFSGLPATLDEFRLRSENGNLFGVFDEGKLLGSLSCVRVNKEKIDSYQTWDEATTKGTLKNNNPEGDSLLCVAISVSGKEYKKQYLEDEEKLKKLAPANIEGYINSGKDFVLNFHTKGKAGIEGAKVYKTLEKGREEDWDSMGYNVIMKYPEISEDTELLPDPNASASIKLIEAALFYAKENGIKNVFAFSRPAGFRDYLMQKYG